MAIRNVQYTAFNSASIFQQQFTANIIISAKHITFLFYFWFTIVILKKLDR